MNVNVNYTKAKADRSTLLSHNMMDNRLGFWADVEEVDAVNNRVNVIADTGMKVKGIPVVSDEWVSKKNNQRNYTTASRNLPPVGARVFILMPTHTIAGAFVLCSGYAYGESNTQELFAAESNKKRFEKESCRISQGGWKSTENYEKGNITYKSNDEKVSVEIVLADDSEVKLTKGLKIKAWNNEILITENELKITTNKKLSVKSTEDFELDATGKNVNIKCSKFAVNNTDFTVG